MTPEPISSPFKDVGDRYQTSFETQLQREIGTSLTGGMDQKYGVWDYQVCFCLDMPLLLV